MFGLAVNFGFPGVIMWGAASSATTKTGCHNLKKNLETTSGPYVAYLIKRTEMCSKEFCSSNGRCYDSRFRSGQLEHMKYSSVLHALTLPFNRKVNKKYIKCSCYPHWKGSKCQTKT